MGTPRRVRARDPVRRVGPALRLGAAADRHREHREPGPGRERLEVPAHGGRRALHRRPPGQLRHLPPAPAGPLEQAHLRAAVRGRDALHAGDVARLDRLAPDFRRDAPLLRIRRHGERPIPLHDPLHAHEPVPRDVAHADGGRITLLLRAVPRERVVHDEARHHAPTRDRDEVGPRDPVLQVLLRVRRGDPRIDHHGGHLREPAAE